MNPDIKAQWVAALRSDKYQQGRGALHKNLEGEDRYCCLGVLCELAIESGVQVEKGMENGTRTVYDGRYSFLPPSVSDWAGLPDGSPSVRPYSGMSDKVGLHTVNDNGKNFQQIALLIEEQL